MLRTLRDTAPVTVATGPDGSEFFAVTRYDLIQDVARRTDDFSNLIGHLLFAGGSMSPRVLEVMQSAEWISPGLLLVSDDPEHKRYRALVNAAFAYGRVSNMTPIIERIVDDLIDDFVEKGECDFVNQFAVLLPTFIIADILGLDRDHYHLVRQWSDAVIGIVSRMGSEEEELAAAEKVIAFRRFILESIARRREDPKDDLISALILAEVEGYDPLTDGEIAPITFEIAVAGNETTRNTLMSGLARLVRNPDQMEKMRSDPALIANAVEEMLRYETPATSMWRVAARDTELDGVAIPEGSNILLRYDAANRDPAVFEAPDSFDVTRKNANRHFAFGAPGIHRCLGQMLARKEMAVAWPKLLDRLRDIRIIEDRSSLAYWPGLLHRGIGPELHIAFTPGSRLERPASQ